MPAGRPTKYKEEYCKDIVNYFNREPVTIEGGKIIPCDIPLVGKYAISIDVTRETLHEWCRVHPEFSDAYNKAREYQRAILISMGIRGLYNPSFSVFAAKNMIGWRDKTEVDLTGKINIVAGKVKKPKNAGQ